MIKKFTSVYKVQKFCIIKVQNYDENQVPHKKNEGKKNARKLIRNEKLGWTIYDLKLVRLKTFYNKNGYIQPISWKENSLPISLSACWSLNRKSKKSGHNMYCNINITYDKEK